MTNGEGLRQAEKLIGGWVAGTLTSAEHAQLMQAALANQTLFDALADEEGLRELLADPQLRRELIAALSPAAPPPIPEKESWWGRLFRPGPMAAFSAGVLAVVALVVIRPAFLEQQQQPKPTERVMAEREAPVVEKAPEVRQQPLPAGQPRKAASGPAVAPAAEAVADAKKELDLTEERLSKMTDGPPEASKDSALRAVGPPPPPPPPPPAAVVATTGVGNRADEAKAKAPARRNAAPPIRYRVERFQEQDSQWVEYGGELSRGARARLAIEVAQAGVLSIRSTGRNPSFVPVKAGETVFFPPDGNLPATAGELEIALQFQPSASAVGGLGAAGSPSSPNFFRTQEAVARQRQRAAPGAGDGGQQQGQAPAAPQQQQQQQRKEAESVSDDAAPSLPPADGDYSVTVRLRYR